MADSLNSSLYDTLKELTRWFDDRKYHYIIIGGFAVSLQGYPRVTRDIDLLLLLDDRYWEELITAAPTFGFITRRDDALAFARRNRVLLLMHSKTQTPVDISFGILPFELEAYKRKIQFICGDLSLPLACPEDLIVMKALARRPRDVSDIEGLLDSNPSVKIPAVTRTIREFSEILEMPEIIDEFKRILSYRNKKKKRQGRRNSSDQ